MPSWDGSSFAGWTVSGATIDSSIGNPAPSFHCTPNQYAYINATQIASTNIDFDVYIDGATVGLCDFFFGCNSSGNGYIVRIDSRGGGNVCGIATSSSWTSWSSPGGGGPTAAVTTWQHVKLVINNLGTLVSFYFAGAFVGTSSVTLPGTYIGLQGDGGANGGHFDNIVVTPVTYTITAPNIIAPVANAGAGAHHQPVKAPAPAVPPSGAGGGNYGYTA